MSQAVGIIGEMVFYSLGLGHRMKMLEVEKRKSEQQLNQVLREQNLVLEQKVQERTEEIKAQNEELSTTLEKVEIEREKSESLLLNILPHDTAQELKEKGYASTKHYERVSVLFTDFKGFTSISEKMSPEEVVENLNYCFSAFDDIVKKHGLEKIKTIGDAYMAAGGIPLPDADNAQRAVNAALEMVAFMNAWKAEKEAQGKNVWEVRIGIHTGPVVAGVVGKDKFAYDIWGDTVNTSSRMESSGVPGKVNISDATHQILVSSVGVSSVGRPTTAYQFEYRGEVEAKGKGKVGMWFVE